MPDEPRSHSWWQTLPGVLTAMAAIITAVAGLIVALYQAGFFQDARSDRVPASTDAAPASEYAAPRDKPAAPEAARAVPPPAQKVPALAARRTNLLDAEAGGQLLVASSDDWKGTIDGKEEFNQIGYGIGKEAVYGFKDDRAAVFDLFTVLIAATDQANVKEFELLAGNDTPTGPFESIGRFQTQNVKLFKSPYQEFRFEPVTAKYLKVRVLASYGATHPVLREIQLFGHLK